jgi:hypothetical protein
MTHMLDTLQPLVLVQKKTNFRKQVVYLSSGKVLNLYVLVYLRSWRIDTETGYIERILPSTLHN